MLTHMSCEFIVLLLFKSLIVKCRATMFYLIGKRTEQFVNKRCIIKYAVDISTHAFIAYHIAVFTTIVKNSKWLGWCIAKRYGFAHVYLIAVHAVVEAHLSGTLLTGNDADAARFRELLLGES